MFNPPQDSSKEALDNSRSEFFANTSIDKIEQLKKKDAEAKQRLEAEREEYKKACQAIFASDSGKFVLKHLIKYCGIYHFDNKAPDGNLAVEKGRRSVYLEAIRPFLDKTTLIEVENQ